MTVVVKLDVSGLHARFAGSPGVFVTGTDTGVGKTVAASALIRALAREGMRVAGMKPVAAGADGTKAGLRNEDALALAAAANISAPYDSVNPYCLVAPASPHIAAADEGVTIDPLVVKEHFRKLATLADIVVVEGAGGWLAPIGPARTMADIARALELPVLLVTGLRLGCLSHSLLTREAIAASGLPFAGWIANRVDPHFARAPENIEALTRMLGSAPLAVLDFQSPPGNLPEAGKLL